MVDMARLSVSARAWFDALAAEAALHRHTSAFAAIDGLATGYIQSAIREVRATVDSSLEDASGPPGAGAPLRTRLIARYLEIDGAQSRSCETESPDPPPEGGSLAALAERIRRDHPEYRSMTDLVVSCGRHLADVLRGTRTGLSALFPDNSTALTEELFSTTPESRVFNGTVGRIVDACRQEIHPRPLAVLEVGGGTASTSLAVLDATSGQVDYEFTDVSLFWLARARSRLRAFGQVRFRRLNLDTHADEDRAGRYDVIIAANAIHTARDVAATVRALRRWLQPKGVLVAVECTSPGPWLDATFALAHSWWSATDARHDGPLLSRGQWIALLSVAGFEHVSCVPGSDGMVPNTILLAQACPGAN